MKMPVTILCYAQEPGGTYYVKYFGQLLLISALRFSDGYSNVPEPVAVHVLKLIDGRCSATACGLYCPAPGTNPPRPASSSGPSPHNTTVKQREARSEPRRAAPVCGRRLSNESPPVYYNRHAHSVNLHVI